ncbi:MAG: ATP-binding protein [Candidatus Lokiarchaeota archaeon]|nr:ATP-binding protein [Candidatus Lokiarchaeota archaeon]
MRKAIWILPSRKTLTMLIGLPGSGKSTLIMRIMKKDARGRIVVSSDEIRFRLLNYEESGRDFDPSIETKVWALLEKEIQEALENPITKEILFDATNVRREFRSKYLNLARESGFKTKALVIYKELTEIKQQNTNRSRIVPEEVIDKLYKRFQPPDHIEFDKIVNIGSRKKYLAFQKCKTKKHCFSRLMDWM